MTASSANIVSSRHDEPASSDQREGLLAAQRDAFQAAMNGADLATSLGFLVKLATDWQDDGRRCAFYVRDAAGTGLAHVVGMSEAYVRDVTGFQISPESFACGLAIAIGERQITPDVMTALKWAEWRWMASNHGFRGCWSFPIETASGKRVGSFAMYHAEPLDAESLDIELAEAITHTAAIIISQHQETILRIQGEERYRTLFDTLEQRVAERTAQLRRSEEQLRQSQKMEAVGQLTGGIAHDFNNMLTGISGSLEMIKRRMDAGRTDGIERFMDTANSAVQRAAGLTHRLLAFARRQPLDTKSHDLVALISDMEDMLQRTLGEKVVLETHFEPGLWSGLTDSNQFENAILNLAINARDAMPDGGQLTIETRNASLDAAYTETRPDAIPGDYVAVSVSDTGVGMPPDVIAKAFDPFFTTKPLGEGTGLGLSVIYGFAKQTGGHVRIHSEPGQGTTVTIYVPRILGAQEIESSAVQGLAPHGEGEAILVVEDDSAVRPIIGEILLELGYRYYEAADAQSAIKIIESGVPIDLLISDVGLPVMNGRQLAEFARDRRAGLKVLFVTGYAENALMRREFLAPGMDIMAKPFVLADLAQKVRALIN